MTTAPKITSPPPITTIPIIITSPPEVTTVPIITSPPEVSIEPEITVEPGQGGGVSPLPSIGTLIPNGGGGSGMPTPTPPFYCNRKCQTSINGDANCNGKIEVYDIEVWRSEFKDQNGDTVKKKDWNADFNCDGFVNFDDQLIWLKNYEVLENQIPENIGSCSWCGTSCVKNDPNLMRSCAAVLPPKDKVCTILNDGTCVIKGLGLIPINPNGETIDQ